MFIFLQSFLRLRSVFCRTFLVKFFLLLVSTEVNLLTHALHLSFPESPDRTLSPGSLCTRPIKYRYPERIAYCERNVESEQKQKIIENYDELLGFEIRSMNRIEFKIDHHIPLCAGGSNENDNLWPQHRSVYEQTDPIEPQLCKLMSMGKMRQVEAVEIIKEVKAKPKTSKEVLRKLLDREYDNDLFEITHAEDLRYLLE